LDEGKGQVHAWEIPRAAGMSRMSIGICCLRLEGADGVRQPGLVRRYRRADAR
jgi:hypothetical protein